MNQYKKITTVGIYFLNLILFTVFALINSYPFILVLLHSLSLAILISIHIPWKHAYSFLRIHRLNFLIIILLFTFSILLRIYRIEEITPGMWGDEVTAAQAGLLLFQSYNFVPFVDINFGHPTPLLYLQGFFVSLFGKTLLAIRMVSVIFGSLSVAAFYVLLHLRWKTTISILGALILMFLYPHIVVSRLGYEITAALFFQILSLIFIYKIYKNPYTRLYHIALGLSLAGGLYTYIGFRTHAIFLFLAYIIVLYCVNKNWKKTAAESLYTFSTTFTAIVPLAVFSITHFEVFWARTTAISVFNYGLPPVEVLKELGGSIARLSHIFFFTGDPNPRQNPAGVSLFDIFTTLLIFIGIITTFKKYKKIFYLLLLLILPSIINDIFSLERIPEFHYYGLGHPNLLRIAGIIPIFLIFSIFGLEYITKIAKRVSLQFSHLLLMLVLFSIIGINYFLYFRQPISIYNYEHNGVRMLDTAKLINQYPDIRHGFISSSLQSDERIEFFVRDTIQLHTFNPKNIEETREIIRNSHLVIVDAREHEAILQSLLTFVSNEDFKTLFIHNPRGGVEVVAILQK